MRTKQQATVAGEKLLTRMKGKGWRLSVWECMGWHYMVRLGTLQIHTQGGGLFQSLLGEKPQDIRCGSYVWECRSQMTDPNKLVARHLRIARKAVTRLDAIVTALETAVKA